MRLPVADEVVVPAGGGCTTLQGGRVHRDLEMGAVEMSEVEG